MKKYKSIMIISFLMLIILLFVLNSYGNKDSNPKTNQDNSNQDINEDNEIGEIGSINPLSGDGQNTNSDDSSNSQVTNSENCIEKQISYSMGNFIKESTCNQYDGDNCIDKTIICSLNTKNLDYEMQGIFGVNFKFLQENNEISSENVEYLINPREEKLFASEFNIKGQSANNDLTCSYSTSKIPKKLVC